VSRGAAAGPVGAAVTVCLCVCRAVFDLNCAVVAARFASAYCVARFDADPIFASVAFRDWYEAPAPFDFAVENRLTVFYGEAHTRSWRFAHYFRSLSAAISGPRRFPP
jgi:hypothetical protein